jgi:Transposase, Mutator family
MTVATIELADTADMADQGPYVDLLRQVVQFMAQRLMDMDVESLCGAGYDENSAERLNSRNGSSGTTSCCGGARAPYLARPSTNRRITRRSAMASAALRHDIRSSSSWRAWGTIAA